MGETAVVAEGCVKPQSNALPNDMLPIAQRVKNEPLLSTNSTNKDLHSNLVDLEEIVMNWSRVVFNATKSKQEAKIKKKYLSFNINWTKLFQESMEPDYSPGVDKTLTKRMPQEEKVLFKTTFTNTTQREQEYSFKTERTTRSTSTVIVEKGVCRGVQMELKLKTPCEVVEAGAGFAQEVSLNHIGENSVEEELTWGVDSCVRVPPNSETCAELVVLEEQMVRNFSIRNTLFGKVLVTVTNLKENNSLITILEGNIVDIIRGMGDHGAKGFTLDGHTVLYDTKGQCIFRYGVEQKVKINEMAIRSYK
ncbi:unnamed protein product, partial [Mesorhabditis spiculigera]